MTEEANTKKSKLESLNQQLEEVKKLRPEESSEVRSSSDSAKIAIDFASATAVGSLLGWGFDQWQNSLPWGLLVGLVIGTIAGTKLMFETLAKQQASEAQKTNQND